MFQTGSYIKYLISFFALSIISLFNVNDGLGQDCTDVTYGNSSTFPNRAESETAGVGKSCAPLIVDAAPFIQADIDGVTGASNIEFEINWGDGTPAVRYPAVQWTNDNSYYVLDMTTFTGPVNGATDPNGDGLTDQGQGFALATDPDLIARKRYDPGLGVCEITISAELVVNGNLCGNRQSFTVSYWDQDNETPSNLIIFEEVYLVCAGDEVDVTFFDNTTFNCVNAADLPNTNDVNNEVRNVRWTYNTTDGPAPNGRIDGIELSDGETLDGSNPAEQDYLPDQGDIAGGADANIVEEYPEPVNGVANATSETLQISVPSTATEGQVFEVKLENWGPCNPYDGLGTFDPIERYAIIRIVAPPEDLDFTISDDVNGTNTRDEFCPGEDIRFRGSVSNLNGNADYDFDWEIYDGNTAAADLVGTITNDRLTWLSDTGEDLNTIFTTSGEKLIRMIVQNTDNDLTGNCTVFEDRIIEIIETPTPTIATDDLSGSGPDDTIESLSFCEGDLPLNFTFTDETPDRNGSSESRWTVFDNDNNIEAGGGGYGAPSAAPDNQGFLTSYTFNSTGHYKVVLEIRDGTTSCEASDTVNILIYDTPEAEFTGTGVCEGEDTDFDPSGSNIPTVINGEVIDQWLWDFSYDGTTFNTELTRTNDNIFSKNLGSAGDYDVALITRSDKGCYSDTTVNTITVYANPDADIQAFYGQDYEGFQEDDPYLGDPICPGTLIKFFNNSDEFNNDASVIDVDYYLEIDSLSTIITKSIGDSGSFLIPDIFDNQNASNEIYSIRLVATANPTDGNPENNCLIKSTPILVDVLPGSASGFDIFESLSPDISYNPPYCSPQEFYFRIDNTTNNRLNANDSVVWTAKNGNTILGGDTIIYSGGNREDYDFNFIFENNYPNVGPINFTVELQPYAQGVCISSSERTVTVRPRPTSDFSPSDTVVTCDSVTYYFEAIQPGLLEYDWQVQPIADTLSTQNDGDNFWVSYDRPENGFANVNVEVRLQTTNPFGCQSDLSNPFNDTIFAKDDIEIVLDTVGNEFCAPAVYGFVNKTTDSIPAGTEWELIIKNLDLNDSTIIDGNTLTGNTDFRDSTTNIFEYEFTDSANYEISLNALLPSTCDVASDPPISLGINESPTVGFDLNRTEGCAPFSFTFQDDVSQIPSDGDYNLSYKVTRPNGTVVPEYSGTIAMGPSNPTNELNGLTLSNLTVPAGSPFIVYDVTVTAETFAECSADSTISITVFQEPDIDFNVISTNPACQEDYNFQFEVVTNNITNADYELTWNWGDGQSLTTTEDSIVNHIFSNRASFFGSDSYTVNLSIETEYGCTENISKTVTLNPRIQAQFNASTQQGCDPLNVTFTSSSLGTNISGGHEYFRRLQGETTWDPFDSTANITNSGTVSEQFQNNSTSTEIWEILYVVQGEGGCRDTADLKEITVFPSPEFEVNVAETPLCQIDENGDYEFEFELENVAVPTGTEFTWNWGDGSAPLVTTSDANQTHIFTNRLSYFGSDNYTITVTAETNDGCILNETLAIQLHPQIEASYNVNQTENCSPASFIFTSTSRGTNLTGNHQYFKRQQGDTPWLPFDGTISPSGNVTEDLTNNTNTIQVWEILYTVESAAGCIDSTDIEEITVFSDPNFDLNVVESPLCQANLNGDYEFEFALENVDVPTGTEFTWTWGDGSTPLETTDQVNQSHIFNNRLSNFGSDNYTVTVTAETPDGCTLNETVNIQLHPQVEAIFSSNIEQGCDPQSVIFTSSSSGLSLGGGHEYYRRLKGESTWNPIDSVSNIGSVSEYFENNSNSAEIWEILYMVESGVGACRDTAAIKEITIFPSPGFEVDVAESPLCQIDDGGDYEFEFELSNVDVPAGTEFTWNWGDGSTPLVTTDQVNQSHIFNNRLSYFGSDNYTVTVTAKTPDECTLIETVNIQLRPQIEAIFFQSRDEGCAPLEVNFTSSSRGTGITNNHVYQQRIQGETNWNTIAGTSANGTASFTFDNTTGNDLIYEVRHLISSDVGNCMDTSDIQEITVFTEFDSPIITGSDEVCSFAQSVEYSVSNTATSSYNWSLPQGAFITDQNANGSEVEINFSSFSGDIEVTEINENGCFGTPRLLSVTVLTGPTVDLSLNGPNTICPGDETSLRFDLTGEGNQGFDVIYSNGQQTDTLENIQDGHIETINPTESRNYFVLDVIDRQYPDCSAGDVSGSAFINVNFAPTATISGNTTICEDGSTNLFINLTGVGPWDVTYSDGNSNFIIENISSPVHQLEVSPEQNTTYELVSVTDNNTPVCSGTVSGSALVQINSKPTAEISGNFNNVCANDFVQLNVALTGYEPWTVRYTDGDNIFTVPNITPEGAFDPETDTYNHSFDVFPTTGTTNYTLVDVRDSNSPACLGDISGTATVTAFDRPTVEISGNATICKGESSAITFNFTGDGPFDLALSTNQDTTAYENLVDGQSIDFTPESTTTYRVVSLNDQRNCTGNSLGGPVSINVNNLPTSEISGNDVTCNGEETELIFDQTGVGPWTITYTNGSQNFSFTTAFNRHFEPVFPTTTTTYSLVSVVDSNSPNSCSGTVSGSALKEVFPELEANFEATPQDMILPESTVTITNNTSNKNEWEYEWNFGDGTTSNEIDPSPHEYGTFGTFVIRMTATNGQCTDTYQTSVTIGAIPPIVDFDANPREGCLPLVVEFENLTQFADPSTYQWEFGDGQRVSAVENPTHVYRNPGTYTVTLSANNITGQRTEMVKEEFIVVNETPVASFTIPDEYRQVFTTEEVRFVNLSEGADEFIWKFGDGNESFEEEPIHAYPDSGIYDITLIAINSETGCTDSMTLSSQVQVILGGESDVPNAFTPSRAGPNTASNNPLQNDFFLPKVEGVSEFNMKIYNRWGELLFESNDRTVGWDGYYNGVLMPQGVYVYRLELVFENGRRETKIGDITLIR